MHGSPYIFPRGQSTRINVRARACKLQVIKVDNIWKYWSSIKCPSNNGKSSWKSAWKTPGVCSGLSQAAYFQAALALRDKINPLARLVSKST